jgi:hypothetical protein
VGGLCSIRGRDEKCMNELFEKTSREEATWKT